MSQTLNSKAERELDSMENTPAAGSGFGFGMGLTLGLSMGFDSRVYRAKCIIRLNQFNTLLPAGGSERNFLHQRHTGG